MRKIANIMVHCSDSLWGCAREIRKWHMERGWSDCAYHFVILNGKPTVGHEKNNLMIPALDGQIECGRYLDDDGFLSDLEIGAHTLGFNQQSIGICLIGTTQFSALQHHALGRLVNDLMMHYPIPITAVMGHYETANGKEQGKTCPNLDMDVFRSMLNPPEPISA